jgi:hypothetical protein
VRDAPRGKDCRARQPLPVWPAAAFAQPAGGGARRYVVRLAVGAPSHIPKRPEDGISIQNGS